MHDLELRLTLLARGHPRSEAAFLKIKPHLARLTVSDGRDAIDLLIGTLFYDEHIVPPVEVPSDPSQLLTMFSRRVKYGYTGRHGCIHCVLVRRRRLMDARAYLIPYENEILISRARAFVPITPADYNIALALVSAVLIEADRVETTTRRRTSRVHQRSVPSPAQVQAVLYNNDLLSIIIMHTPLNARWRMVGVCWSWRQLILAHPRILPLNFATALPRHIAWRLESKGMLCGECRGAVRLKYVKLCADCFTSF